LQKIEDFVHEFSRRHKNCPRLNPNSLFLPTRLVYVGTQQKPTLRLDDRTCYVREPWPWSLTEYIALSHCWGGDVAGKLTTKNYASLRESISESPESLPQNFIDAIKITRVMGVRYLWIDSLCVLQDSASDWADESPTMGQVFSGAYCVIAAIASEKSGGGCFRDRPRSFDPFSLHSKRSLIATTASENSSGGRFRDRPRFFDISLLHSEERSLCHISTPRLSTRTFFGTRVDTAPLTKRAWAFQERLLSRRVVHFCSNVILFECNTV
jgi:hypothetical protein